MSSNMRAIVVMGVSGCGKTSVAMALCERIGAHLIEGDAFHPEQNIHKMKAGIALTDADRQGWLEQLGQGLAQAVASNQIAVLTCSALKRRYRDALRAAVPNLGFVFLELPLAAAAERVGQRPNHFMPVALVDSQFRDLEPPTGEPHVLTVNGTDPLPVIIDRTVAWWQASSQIAAVGD
ncbi:gluconokinase [Dyella sp. OK004]|uniref:gluconokinase n=1 Tax=Dyella sp. OK004 TaxID=1855292 RepID=UPI0008DEF95E|nr:gluconokinase, GntK/IdnK-type [Dyella sp. OK004]SFR89669.1 gluconokinase [Dyella sp. OK004]